MAQLALGKHEITAHFHALRHAGDVGNRDEESIPLGSIVNVKDYHLEGNIAPVACVIFDFDGNEWDAMFDTPDDNGELAPIGTFRQVLYCADPRHGTPCPLPCSTCAEECDGSTTTESI